MSPGLRPLNFGTLPAVATLRIVAKFEGLPAGVTSVEELHRELQTLLRHGEMATLRVLLERIGFEWTNPVTATLEAALKGAAS